MTGESWCGTRKVRFARRRADLRLSFSRTNFFLFPVATRGRWSDGRVGRVPDAPGSTYLPARSNRGLGSSGGQNCNRGVTYLWTSRIFARDIATIARTFFQSRFFQALRSRETPAPSRSTLAHLFSPSLRRRVAGSVETHQKKKNSRRARLGARSDGGVRVRPRPPGAGALLGSRGAPRGGRRRQQRTVLRRRRRERVGGSWRRGEGARGGREQRRVAPDEAERARVVFGRWLGEDLERRARGKRGSTVTLRDGGALREELTPFRVRGMRTL